MSILDEVLPITKVVARWTGQKQDDQDNPLAESITLFCKAQRAADVRNLATELRRRTDVVLVDPSAYRQGWHFGLRTLALELEAMLDAAKETGR